MEQPWLQSVLDYATNEELSNETITRYYIDGTILVGIVNGEPSNEIALYENDDLIFLNEAQHEIIKELCKNGLITYEEAPTQNYRVACYETVHGYLSIEASSVSEAITLANKELADSGMENSYKVFDREFSACTAETTQL